MKKELLNDTLELESFLKNDLLRKKEFIPKRGVITSRTAFLKSKLLFNKLSNGTRRLKSSQELPVQENKISTNRNVILQSTNKEVYDFVKTYLPDSEEESNLVIPKNKRLSAFGNLNNIQNVFVLSKLNDFRMINKHLEEVNQNLPYRGKLLGCFETFKSRNSQRKVYQIPVIKHLFGASQFIFMRAFPKLPVLKKIYFQVTKGKDRLLSKAEALGRLVSCGFEIIDYKQIHGIHYFVAKKVKEPAFDMNPSYGPLFRMNRIGKNGKIIGVYKLRTMHPYSEYLQDYILKLNGYSKTGKPANDFRVVPWGRLFRRFWIDEFPQIINVLKGDMKLVGSRPVSERYFNDIPQDIQELRLKHKPGCIPPYVALNRNSSVESVLQAEKEYLLEKERNPYFTDTKYFFKAIYNILIGGKRSA